jgi:hypothetical protein
MIGLDRIDWRDWVGWVGWFDSVDLIAVAHDTRHLRR